MTQRKDRDVKQEAHCLGQYGAAKMLGVSISTLATWRRDGVGPQYIKVDPLRARSKILYRIEAITEWMKAHEMKTFY